MTKIVYILKGHDNLDLLKTRDILPSNGVQPPEIKLPQGYANCDNCSPEYGFQIKLKFNIIYLPFLFILFRIIRCTLNKFPSSKNLLDKSRLPLGILIHPYKDLSVSGLYFNFFFLNILLGEDYKLANY